MGPFSATGMASCSFINKQKIKNKAVGYNQGSAAKVAQEVQQAAITEALETAKQRLTALASRLKS